MKKEGIIPLAWEEVDTEHIVREKWIDFRRSSYRFPDGKVYEPFYSYSRKNYVVIVASDEEIDELIAKGEFQQAMHVAAWLMTSKKGDSYEDSRF